MEQSPNRKKGYEILNGLNESICKLNRLLELALSRSGTTCAFCAADVNSLEELRQHIRECTKHPMRSLEEHNRDLVMRITKLEN